MRLKIVDAAVVRTRERSVARVRTDFKVDSARFVWIAGAQTARLMIVCVDCLMGTWLAGWTRACVKRMVLAAWTCRCVRSRPPPPHPR
jgi:hypothetical protein